MIDMQSLGGSRCCVTRAPLLRHHFGVFARRNTAQSAPHHALRGGVITLQRFKRRHAHFTALFLAQARTIHFDLPVTKTDGAVPLSVPADMAAVLSRRARPRYFFGTVTQNGFDSLAPDAVDHFIHSYASLRDPFNEGGLANPVFLLRKLLAGQP
jgi:hypothetical protein